jgi:hypothetical protein
MQHRPDLQYDGRACPPEHAQINLAAVTVSVAHHHLDQIRSPQPHIDVEVQRPISLGDGPFHLLRGAPPGSEQINVLSSFPPSADSCRSHLNPECRESKATPEKPQVIAVGYGASLCR